MAYNIFDFSHFWSNLKTMLNNKVDKVSGMGLSQNSFTNAEKTKLANTYIKSEVDDAIEEAIEHGGGGTTDYNELTNKPSINGVVLIGNKITSDLGIEGNAQADWDETDSEAPSYIKNKPNIPSGVVVDTTYDGTSENAQSGVAVAQAISTKVDKVTGKGLSTNDFTNTDKANLATALEKANAAAPQSTTYTKAEVDTALAEKLNTADVDTALSSTSTNPVQNKAIALALDSKADATDIPTVPITAIQKNSTDITPVSGTVNITVPTTAADISALPDTTKYAVALSLTINSSTFVVTGQLKDQNGDNLGTAQTIDLPLESVVVGGAYDSQTKKVVLTLQNGNAIEFSVADLVSGLQTEISASNKLNPAYINYDSTHRAVSDTEKSTWNNKQDSLTTAQIAAVNSGITAERLETIDAALGDKVDKVTGKGLSTNDFTNADKTKLEGIETGAEANVQADWAQTDTTADDYIKNKPTIPSPVTIDQTYSAVSTNAQSGVAVAQAISTKVDKVTGKGLSTNDFTNTDKANLATALEKANAAAPQSTTYTKAEVDTALAEKLNTADVDTALSSTSTNPVQNKAVHAPVARLVDAGAKNLADMSNPSTVRNTDYTPLTDGGVRLSCSNKSWTQYTVTVDVTAGKNYVFSLKVENVTGDLSSGHIFIRDEGNTNYSEKNVTAAGEYILTFTPATSIARIMFFVNNSSTSKTVSLDAYGMLCTGADYAISPEFVPYAKSNYELTQITEPIPRLVDAGAKNIANVGAAPSRSDLDIQVANGHVSISGTLTGTFTWRAAVFDDFVCKTDMVVIGAKNRTGVSYQCRYTNSAGTARYDQIPDGGILTIPAGSTIQYLYFQQNTGGVYISIEVDVMICTAEDYAISSEFVPYAMSNAELTEKEQQNEDNIAFLAMRKVYSAVHNTSTTHTYTVKTSDFNNSQAGTYLITIVTWSATPSFSLYAVSYSGNVTTNTNLTKVAGSDANISVTDGVISCTTTGKIQIFAVH